MTTRTALTRQWRPRSASACGHSFLPEWLHSDAVVVDLGAQRGRFALQMIDRFKIRCYAVEASPYLVREIPFHERLSVFNFAVGAVDGNVPFYVSEKAYSSSLFPRTDRRMLETLNVPGKRLETFLRENRLDVIDLLKVDIEGAEVLLFDSVSDETFKRIGQIAVEFHEPQGLVSAADMKRVRRRLGRLGFRMIQFSLNSWDCLFVNQARCPMTVFRWMFFHYVVRAVRALRVARKRIRKRKAARAAVRAGEPRA
jgi:FkbM family methyltransferase